MRRLIATPFVVAIAGLLATTNTASAQDAASFFDALAGRVGIDQQIWVTDVTGREVRGRLEQLTRVALVLRTTARETFGASDIRRVRARDRDSLKNGTLVGVVAGAGLGTAWCVGAIADDSGDLDARVECAEGYTVFPALGAVIGLAVDALLPGRIRVVYEATGAGQTWRPRLSVGPLVSSGARGLTVTVTF